MTQHIQSSLHPKAIIDTKEVRMFDTAGDDDKATCGRETIDMLNVDEPGRYELLDFGKACERLNELRSEQ